MPDVNSIPFKQADPNGHYRGKQLPNDSGDFMEMLGLPAFAGDVVGPGGVTPGQSVVFSDSTGKRIDAAIQTGLAKLSGGVLSAVTAPVGDVVGTTDPQTLTNKTLINPTIEGLTGFDKDDVGLGNVDNTSDANKPVSGPQQAALDLKEDKNKKAVANGYASLDASVKIPLAQIPDSVLGGQQYQGTWNAATNTPAIPTAVLGNKGWYYSVSVAGSTNINGISSWAVGDEIISNGSVWQKIVNVSAVNSVNGYTGVVVLGKADVGLGNVDNTSDSAKPVSAATVVQLDLKEDKTNKNVANGYAGLDATGKVPAANVPADLVTSVAGKQGVVTLVKGDVGLGNVDNTSDATKNSATATLTNKTINGANNTLTVRLASDVTGNLPVTNLNAGTGANSGSFWRGDGQWAPPAGGGDVVGPAGAVDGDVAVFNGTTGKIIKTLGKPIGDFVTGPASAVAGRIASYNGTTGKLIADGGKLAADVVTGPASVTDGQLAIFSGSTGKLLRAALDTGIVVVSGGVQATVAQPAGAIVGTTDTQTLTGKTLDSPVITRLTQSYRPAGLVISHTAVVTQSTVGTTTVWTFVAPAGLFEKNGDTMRLYCHNVTAGTGAVPRGIRILFGGVNAYDQSSSSPSVYHWANTVMLSRVSATQLRVSGGRVFDGNGGYAESNVYTVDFSLVVNVSLLVVVSSTPSGGTASHHYFSTLEFLPLL